jgi:hypothetical protein
LAKFNSCLPHLAKVTRSLPHLAKVANCLSNLAKVASYLPHLAKVASCLPHLAKVNGWLPHLAKVTSCLPHLAIATSFLVTLGNSYQLFAKSLPRVLRPPADEAAKLSEAATAACPKHGNGVKRNSGIKQGNNRSFRPVLELIVSQ